MTNVSFIQPLDIGVCRSNYIDAVAMLRTEDQQALTYINCVLDCIEQLHRGNKVRMDERFAHSLGKYHTRYKGRHDLLRAINFSIVLRRVERDQK